MTQRQITWNTNWWLGAARAARLRCPRCGDGKLFRRFFVMDESCAVCGLNFDRGDGYWLGAMMFNMAFAMTSVIGSFLAVLLLTSPDPNWDLMIIVTVAAGLLTPVVFFPFSRGLWLAAERAARLRDGAEAE